LGEQGTYEVFIEPKIAESKAPKITAQSVEFVLTDMEGNVIENSDDIVYADEDGKFYIKTAVKVPLLGTKLKLTAKVTFEEKVYDSNAMQYVVSQKISENTKEFYVSGW